MARIVFSNDVKAFSTVIRLRHQQNSSTQHGHTPKVRKLCLKTSKTFRMEWTQHGLWFIPHFQLTRCSLSFLCWTKSRPHNELQSVDLKWWIPKTKHKHFQDITMETWPGCFCYVSEIFMAAICANVLNKLWLFYYHFSSSWVGTVSDLNYLDFRLPATANLIKSLSRE